jgi:GH25 family lysozyme M1 (1,4-beta-N-acetylmuramidase)
MRIGQDTCPLDYGRLTGVPLPTRNPKEASLAHLAHHYDHHPILYSSTNCIAYIYINTFSIFSIVVPTRRGEDGLHYGKQVDERKYQ